MVSGLLLRLVIGPFVKMATFLTIRRTNHDNHDDQIIKHEIGQHFQSYNVRPSDLFQFCKGFLSFYMSTKSCELWGKNPPFLMGVFLGEVWSQQGAKIHLFGIAGGKNPPF